MNFKEIEPDIQDTVNKISLAGAIIALLTWSLIGILRPNLINRVTVRFQVVIALIDIIRHISNYNVRVKSESLCAIVGTFVNFSDNIYVAFNVLLAINADLIFLSRQRPKMTFYPIYTGVMLAYITILNICYYVNGSYGRGRSGNCNFKDNDDKAAFSLYMVYLMETPGVLYCTYVAFLVIFKYNERISELRIIRNHTYVRIDDKISEPAGQIGTLYWRISMYPISCFVTLSPYLVAMFLTSLNINSPVWYRFVFRFCRRLTGTTNFVFMLYDPNFHLALREFAGHIRKKFTRTPKKNETFELGAREQSSPSTGEQSRLDQFGSSEEWHIEFHDGYRMTVQDHIKYL